MPLARARISDFATLYHTGSVGAAAKVQRDQVSYEAIRTTARSCDMSKAGYTYLMPLPITEEEREVTTPTDGDDGSGIGMVVIFKNH